MRRVMLSPVACPAVPYFTHYPINVAIFGEKKLLNVKLCFDFLYNFCLKHLSFQKKSARYYHKCTKVCMQSTRYFCQNL